MSSTVSEGGLEFHYDDSDITLRSSDHVDYRVHKIILSTSSPFFKSMFSLPQPNASVSEMHHPIVDMPENSAIVHSLLAFIYPVVSEAPEFASLDEIMDAFAAAKKYDMAVASRRLNRQFAKSLFIKYNPVVAFCAAYSRKLGDAACIAAKASLKYPMNLDKIAEKLQHIDGVAFYQLYKFHRACSATAAEAVTGTRLTWITKSDCAWWDLANTRCASKCSTYSYRLALDPQEVRSTFTPVYTPSEPIWVASTPYHNFITRAQSVLLEHPCQEAVTAYHFLDPFYKEKVCDNCQLTLRGLPEFSRLLGEEVERRVSEVGDHDNIFHQHITQLSPLKVELELPF